MKSIKNQSPLRYPGGKACLTNFISELARLNNVVGGVYVELYAGGAGAALNLLYDGVFDRIHINDFDYHVYSMWYSMINYTDVFIEKIRNVDVTIKEWYKQKEIYEKGNSVDVIDSGFATFFLNRTNRSGIIFKAGPIGGTKQLGNFKIDVRFNKQALIEKIGKIGNFRDKIKLTNLDAILILENIDIYYPNYENLFLYMDPPYYNKGKMLYLNNYNHENHLELSKALSKITELKWLVSYDNVDEIRQMYSQYRMSSFDLSYTLQSKKFGSELLVFSDILQISESITVNSRETALTLF